MNSSLSVVVPLWNVESTLVGTIEQLLEILPELSDRFEVVLVDDASTDATGETAREVALGYPQVQLIVHPARLGGAEALRNALRFTHGEMLLYTSGRPGFDMHDIRKLWDRKTDGGGVWAMVGGCERRPAADIPAEYVSTIAESPTLPDLLLVPRRLLAGWQTRRDTLDLLGHLRTRGYSIERVDIRGGDGNEPFGPPRPKSQGFARASQGKSSRNLISSRARR